MTQFKDYAQFYDLLYKDKDYEAEVNFVIQGLKKYTHQNVKSILSLGCGTCTHDILLAKLGYRLTCIDKSAEMLSIAREKIAKTNLASKIEILHADASKLSGIKQHDVAISMFNVIGYQTTNQQFAGFLKNIYQALKPGGLLMFDLWQSSGSGLDSSALYRQCLARSQGSPRSTAS